MVIGVLIATAISFLFGYIAQAIFNWFNGVYDVMFWNAFAIEINFRGLSNFSISGLYNAVYTFAIAILRSFLSNNDVLDLLSISTLERETVSRSSSCFSFGFFCVSFIAHTP